MRNTKYAHMGMRELTVRILDKYSELLKRNKSVYVVSRNHYFGIDYGLFNEETIKDFYRDDLELILSNKYSPMNFIELDDIIVLHDGNSQLVVTDYGKEKAVWTGRTKRDGSKEIIYGEGSWTWTEYIMLLSDYRKRVEETMISIIENLKDYTDIDFTSEVKEYYKSLLENGIPEYDKVIINNDKYIIALSNTIHEEFDIETMRTRKYLEDFCYPKLKIEAKEPGELTALEVTNLSYEELDKERQKQFERLIDRKIYQLLDTNELQVKNINTYNLSFSLWNHCIYLQLDSERTGEMRYEIYNSSTGTRWNNKLYGATCKTFSLYKEKLCIQYTQDHFLGDFIPESYAKAKNDLKDYFLAKCGCNESNLMTEIVIRFITKTDRVHKNEKEVIMNLFKI